VCRYEEGCVGQKPWPMLARADDGDTSRGRFLEASSRRLPSSSEETPPRVPRQVKLALSVVSFLQAPPRRSCTALMDAGPSGTFTLICKPWVGTCLWHIYGVPRVDPWRSCSCFRCGVATKLGNDDKLCSLSLEPGACCEY